MYAAPQVSPLWAQILSKLGGSCPSRMLKERLHLERARPELHPPSLCDTKPPVQVARCQLCAGSLGVAPERRLTAPWFVSIQDARRTTLRHRWCSPWTSLATRVWCVAFVWDWLQAHTSRVTTACLSQPDIHRVLVTITKIIPAGPEEPYQLGHSMVCSTAPPTGAGGVHGGQGLPPARCGPVRDGGGSDC